MDEDAQIAVIIINWNHAVETLNCVDMVSGWSGRIADPIVVDNGSSKEDLSLLRNSESHFHLIVNEINRGYGGGNNAGITRALDEGPPYIMLLNNDAKIAEGCVRDLLQCLRHSPDLGVVGPVIAEGKKRYAGGRNIGIYSSTRIPYSPNCSRSELIAVDYVPGSVLLARREAFKRAGLLDEEFFFSGEVADFCKRVRSAGLMCAVYTGCQASHSPDEGSDMRDTLYGYYTLRNRFLYVRRHFRSARFIWYLRWILGGIEQITIALLKGNRRHAHALCLGLLDGVKGRFGDRNGLFIQ